MHTTTSESKQRIATCDTHVLGWNVRLYVYCLNDAPALLITCLHLLELIAYVGPTGHLASFVFTL